MEETRPIRQVVLRPGQPVDTTRYPADQMPEAWHAGAFLGDDLIGVASIYREPPPGSADARAWRLRGMAVLPEHQGRGHGQALVRACLAHVRQQGGAALWCNGRVSAQAFYERLGFRPLGAVFDLPISGPHYLFSRPATLVRVRTFAADEWPLYKQLRLSALANAPQAFGSTLAEGAQRPDEAWAGRLAEGVTSGRDLPLVAEVEGEPAGLAWGRLDDDDATLAHLHQVWVAPSARGLGGGQRLVEAVIAWAREKGAAQLELGVTLGDTPARRLYERLGFEAVGAPEPLRPGSAVLFQPMRLRL